MDPLGALPPDPLYRLALRTLAMHVHPTFFDLATPLTPCQKRVSVLDDVHFIVAIVSLCV